MPTVHVDISIFTPSEAFGKVSGSLELPTIPVVGDTIVFRAIVGIRDGRGDPTESLLSIVKVTDRLLVANEDDQVMLMLDDLTVASAKDARDLMAIFMDRYGMEADVWED